MSGENFHLIVRRGPKPGQIYPLLAATITIGRDPMSDITINDPEISRYHAQLIQVGEGYQIQDMGSTNGTFVAGQRLGPDPVTIEPGQNISFGSGVVLTYETTGGADDPAMATMIEGTETPGTAVSDFVDVPAQPQAAPVSAAPPPVASASPPPPPPSYVQQEPAQPFVPAVDEDAARKKRRNRIIIIVALIILCCCCAIPLSAYFVWGDLLLELLKEQGLMAAVLG